MLKKLNVEPIAKLIGYSVAGLPPKLWVWDLLEQFQSFRSSWNEIKRN